MSELIRLANLCEKATGPDIQLDSWIAHEVHRATGHDIDYYTGSIDAAVTLVPAGWFWQVGYTTSFQAWANVYQTHPTTARKTRTNFTPAVRIGKTSASGRRFSRSAMQRSAPAPRYLRGRPLTRRRALNGIRPPHRAVWDKRGAGHEVPRLWRRSSASRKLMRS